MHRKKQTKPILPKPTRLLTALFDCIIVIPHLHLRERRIQNRHAHGGFDDFGDHVPAVVDEGENPLAVLIDDVGGIVRVPFQIQRIPDDAAGNDVAGKPEQTHRQCGSQSNRDHALL